MIRIERLDDGFLVVDGPWRGAAVSLQDAEIMANHRASPGRLPSPPPNITTGGYDEPEPHVLAARQFDQATGDASCIGGVCAQD